MTVNSQLPAASDLRVLGVDLQAEEYETLTRVLSEVEAGPSLLRLPASAQLFANLARDDLAAVIISLAAFVDIHAALPELGLRGGAVPVLVLVSPGEEPAASPLLGYNHIELVLRSGNYLPLLAAWLPRALSRRQLGWEEIGRIIRHEINNPLTGVLGNAELILSGHNSLPVPVRNRISVIINLAVRMRDVVRTLEERLRQPGNPSPTGSRSNSLSPRPLPRWRTM